MKRIIIDASTSGQRLDKYLKRYLPNAGTGFLYRMLREKKIKLNKARADGKQILKSGDEICIYFADETIAKFMGESGIKEPESTVSKKDREVFAENIIYEDDDVLLLNKPSGMLSQKSRADDVSACELLVDHLISCGRLSHSDMKNYRPSAVNRLDRNTSGILICAGTFRAAKELSEIIKDKTLKKEYLTLVKGHISRGKDLNAYLKKDNASNKVTVSDVYKEGYDRIETAYRPLGYIGNDSLLEIDLKTGKTHQIRAQLSYLGHPVIGDEKYGDKKSNRDYYEKYALKRQFLHACRIRFPGKLDYLKRLQGRCFTAELPKELKRIEGDIIYV